NSIRFLPLSDFISRTKNPRLLDDLNSLSQQLESTNVGQCEHISEHFEQLRKYHIYNDKYESMNKRFNDIKSNTQTTEEYESMLIILKELKLLTNQNIIRMKGRVASLFGNGKELLCTELVYQNILDNLDAAEVAALISSIIFQGKRTNEKDSTNNSIDKQTVTPRLEQAKQRLILVARDLDRLQKHYKIYSYIEEELNFDIMSIIYKWAQGATKFIDIMNDQDLQYIDIQEGTIVRTIMRIEELCGDLRNAAKTVGNTQLFDLMQDVSKGIKRGIVFAPSLYFSDSITIE
ncbi:unnamed protein product, partial [Didymodactylos carnosus]